MALSGALSNKVNAFGEFQAYLGDIGRGGGGSDTGEGLVVQGNINTSSTKMGGCVEQ